MKFYDKNSVAVVVTDYGIYPVHPSEEAAFREVYGDERIAGSGWAGTFSTPKWEDELLNYATEQMKSQWLAG